MAANGRSVSTPCIGVCSTVIGDTVCRGCKRYAHEVVQWNRYDEEQKRLVLGRLDSFLIRIMETKLIITDSQLLEQRLLAAKIPYPSDRAPAAWLFELLRRAAGSIDDLTSFGVTPAAEWKTRSTVELREAIAEEFYQLSAAHYERYHSPPLRNP